MPLSPFKGSYCETTKGPQKTPLTVREERVGQRGAGRRVTMAGFFNLKSRSEHKEGANEPGQTSKKHIKSIERPL